MSFTLFAPVLYLMIGFGLGRTRFDIKSSASALLTRWIIPAVIIYNIATHRPGVFAIMFGMVVMMALLLLLSRALSRDPVKNLCFFYLNIGWLGLPIASSLFGNGATMVIIAAYVGSSLFGNSVGAGLMVQGSDLKTRLWHTCKAPPVWALALGLLCIPLGSAMEQYCSSAYGILKFLMGFLGMAILGMWISKTPLKPADFRTALAPFAARLVAFSALISVFIWLCQYYRVDLVTENQPTLYLLGFLPPAANIIVLETHYMKSGRSASMIACGTCLSIIAIGLYAAAVIAMRA